MFDGTDLLHCSKAQLADIRGKRIAMIFQDPMTSLNPYLRVGEQIIEPLLIHGGVSRADASNARSTRCARSASTTARAACAPTRTSSAAGCASA